MAATSEDSSSEIRKARDNWLSAKDDHSRAVWGEEYRQLRSLQGDKVRADLQRSTSEEVDWSSGFLFSSRVKAWTGAAVPYEQWGIYASILGGSIYFANAYSKAYHVMRAAEAPPGSEARSLHKALAWVSEEQVKHAAILARRFQTRGLIAVLGAPITWLAYIQAKHASRKG